MRIMDNRNVLLILGVLSSVNDFNSKNELHAKSLFKKTKCIFNQGSWDCSGHFYR